MFYKEKKDEGLIEIPAITPHLELIAFDRAELGIGEDYPSEALRDMNFCFYIDAQGNGFGLQGLLTRDLLRLTDGTRRRAEIMAALQELGHADMEINTALANLAYRFILVSADYSLPPESAALFSSMGITPRRAEECLAQLRICIRSISAHDAGVGMVAESFAHLGGDERNIVDDENDANVVIVLVDDYLQPELAEINQRFHASQKRWLPVKASGIEGMAGPLFNVLGERFCMECLRNNLRNAREVRGFLGHTRDGAEVAKEQVFSAPAARGRIAEAMLHVIIAQLAADKYVEVNDKGHFQSLAHYMLSSDMRVGAQTWHYVNKRPQCACCGDDALRDNNRAPQAVDVFRGAAESVFTSGGMKARSPLQTWRKYEHLVSPLTGVVTGVVRSSPPDDSWIHVYWAGSNLAIANQNFRSLSNSLRTKSAGKGRSEMQAKTSALCEALERYSGVYDGSEIHRRARFVDFAEGEAMRPNDIMLFSDKQYGLRQEIASKAFRFYRLPELDFDPNAEVEWTPFWSISREKFVWIMSVQAYFSYFASEMELNKFMANPDSNGAASGNTISEAFVQGFMELVERDAYAIWWYNRLSYPEVDIDSFNDPFLDKLIERYRTEYHRRVWVLDITHDFGIPVFVAVSERTDKQKRDICVSAGAHFDPRIALLRAVCELNQYVSAVLFATDEPSSYEYFDPECLNWWQTATLEGNPYLLPEKGAAKITPADYPIVERSQAEEARACIDAVHEKGMEILVMDQTRPDIGLPVIKVLVPGMRHFWARFGPGRLYDVPVAMDKLSKPTDEQDFNPIPVFI
ncbi:MAG: TOMM precursor leader peptide-binding protein [bacterium]